MRSQFPPRTLVRWLRRPRWLVCLAMATLLLSLAMAPLVSSANASIGTLQAQNGPTLDQQGRSAYAVGDYGEAIEFFHQAATQYQGANQPVRAALALANLGLSHQQLGQGSDANEALQNALVLVPAMADAPVALWSSRGQVLSIHGQLAFAQGDHSAAADIWDQAAQAYERADQPRQVAQQQVNQAKALQSAGFYGRALKQIELALTSQPDDKITVDALHTHGDLLRITGQQDEASRQLTAAEDLATELELPNAVSAVYNSLGRLAQAQGNPDEALRYYQSAAETTPDQLNITTQLNQLQLLIKQSDWESITVLLPPLTASLQAQTASRETIYARLTFAQIGLDLRQTVDDAFAELEMAARVGTEEAPLSTDENRAETNAGVSDVPLDETIDGAIPRLTTAQALRGLATVLPQGETLSTLLLETYGAAQQLNDITAQTYALGALGKLYTQTQQWDIAKRQTLDALNLAQGANLPEVEYQLQEQLCQILQNIETTPSGEAIKACRAAVNTTNLLRKDLAAKGADGAFDFQQQVEPIYRNLIDLLVKTDQNDADYGANLQEARGVLESLQLAELDNFFREACLQVQTVDLDDITDEKTAVIYPIILEDRLEILLSLPNTISHYSSDVGASELDATIRQWQQGIGEEGINRSTGGLVISDSSSSRETVSLATTSQILYEWLIQPLETELAGTDVDTLVFVLDGNLRNVSMSALYDGQQYLIEKYAVALVPGLQLIDPKPIARESIQAFLAGVSESQPDIDDLKNFSPLKGVETELNSVSEIIQGNVLLNEEVTSELLQREIGTSSAPIVHLATHGQFGASFEDTFLVTWQGKLNVNELSQLLKTSELSRERELELLILSACETADGNDRAVLGLAGVATRSGARSTLATLWAVNDDSTAELMSEFYRQLIDTKETKAKALQKAQLKILNTPNFDSPYFWSPFILLGNWL